MKNLLKLIGCEKGSKIQINPKNEGKFREEAERHGMTSLEYAKHVMNDPNASPLLKKRANFCLNASKWKH